MTSTTDSSSPSRSDSPSSSVSSLDVIPLKLNPAQIEAARLFSGENDRHKAHRARTPEHEASMAKQREEQAERSKAITDSTYPSPSTPSAIPQTLTPLPPPDTTRLLHLLKIKTHLLQAQLALASSQSKDATAHANKASSLCEELSLADTLPPTLKARCTYWLGVASHQAGNFLAALECYKAAEPALRALLTPPTLHDAPTLLPSTPNTPFTPQGLEWERERETPGTFEAKRIDRMKARAMREVLKTPMKTGCARVCRDVLSPEAGEPDPVSADWRGVRCENLEEELRGCDSLDVAVAEEEEEVFKVEEMVEETPPVRRELHMRSSSSASVSSTGSLAERRHRSRPSEILVLDKLSL